MNMRDQRTSRVLIVDDEKNIRLTMSQALAGLGHEISTAVNGEDAIKQLQTQEFALMLLDLRMPGMDGMEVLRQVSELRPDTRIIIVTAHGTVENAVEAMKLGAVDFIQKPFAPQEIREIVAKVLDRRQIEARQAADYATHVELAKRNINERLFSAAMEHVRLAIMDDPSRPEAFNLLGALEEIDGDRQEAMKNYRVALDLDPAYEPAWQNLDRLGKAHGVKSQVDLG